MDATYTAEQLRDMASLIEEQEVPADGQQIKMLRAHADALEENARLRVELGKFSDRNGYAMRQRAESAEAELAKLRQHAEAMAEHWENDDTMDLMASAVTAYRRDFPKDEK